MNYQLILGKIKDRDINLEEITRMDLDSKTKAILLYAYYEVNKMGYNIKQLLNQEFWTEDGEMLWLKKRLVERNKQNSKFFDIGYFNNLIVGSAKNSTVNSVEGSLQRISLLRATGELEEALNLCEQPRLAANLTIIKQRIAILKQLERFEEALELCENGPFQDNLAIFIQRIYVLIALGRLDEALKLVKKNRSKNVKILSGLIAKIKWIKIDIDRVIADVEDTGNAITYDSWVLLIEKVEFLINQRAVTNCIGGYLDFLLQVNVQTTGEEFNNYLRDIAHIRRLRDNLSKNLRQLASEVPDGDEGSKHSLNIESY